jgi:hypothetical protein
LSATLLFSTHFGYEPVDDDRAGDAFGLGLEIGQNTVRQYRLSDRFQILQADEVTAMQYRMRLGPAD